jgi:fucose 4-O-acetylase-like acetyltransferase
MNKRHDIELLRVISAFGIVWYHSGAIGHEYSYAGLISFLILSMYLAGLKNSDNFNNLKNRYKRILIPWISWFIFYAILNLAKQKNVIPIQNGFIYGILTGPSTHLWYMPFIFICLTVYDYIKKLASRASITYAAGTISALILLTASFWRKESIQLGYPISLYAHASAGIFLGIFFSAANEIPRKISITFTFIIIISAIYSIPELGVGIPYLLGTILGAILSFKILKNYLNIEVNKIADLTLGIYFIHVLIISLLRKNEYISGIYLPILSFIMSAVIIYIIRNKFPNHAKFIT